MPLIRIDATPAGLRLHGTSASPAAALRNQLTQGTGPVVIMAHGFKSEPGHPQACPHRHILSLSPPGACWKAKSWPRELRIAEHGGEALGIAFGWPARGKIWQVYQRAERAGLALADLICLIHRLAPHRPISALVHSMGARVLLSALPHTPAGALGRAILLNGADFGSSARAALDSAAGQSTQVINVTSRENDLFDFLLELLVRPPMRGDAAISTAMPEHPNALTLQLDHAPTLTALAGAGFAIAPTERRICHWSAYLRPGVFDLYRALLGLEGQLDPERLRRLLPTERDRRWSRLAPLPPRLPGLRPLRGPEPA